MSNFETLARQAHSVFTSVFHADTVYEVGQIPSPFEKEKEVEALIMDGGLAILPVGELDPDIYDTDDIHSDESRWGLVMVDSSGENWLPLSLHRDTKSCLPEVAARIASNAVCEQIYTPDKNGVFPDSDCVCFPN